MILSSILKECGVNGVITKTYDRVSSLFKTVIVELHKFENLNSKLEELENIKVIQSQDLCDMFNRIDSLERVIVDLLEGHCEWREIKEMTGDTEARAKEIEKVGEECLDKFYGSGETESSAESEPNLSYSSDFKSFGPQIGDCYFVETLGVFDRLGEDGCWHRYKRVDSEE
jgi:hypothetical protein